MNGSQNGYLFAHVCGVIILLLHCNAFNTQIILYLFEQICNPIEHKLTFLSIFSFTKTLIYSTIEGLQNILK